MSTTVLERTLPKSSPITIAKASRTLVILVAATGLPAFLALLYSPSLVSAFWLLIHFAAVARASQISLSVTNDAVLIRNFFRTVSVYVWEAEIFVESSGKSVLLSDAGGKLDNDGKMLLVKRWWHGGEMVHVGVAPRFGAEFDRIHRDLEAAIATERAR